MSTDFGILNVPVSRLGTLCVVSGPSGSGKTTLCRRLCSEGLAEFSISCTTRAPREGEVNGVDYHFLSDEEFISRVQNDEFFEWAHVHGNKYGTLKSEVLAKLELGIDVVLDIDVQGAEQVRACQDVAIARSYVDIFILPPSVAELDQRLKGRGTESEERYQLRMQNAVGEMNQWPKYQYTLVSGSQEEDYLRFKSLFVAERMRVSRLLSA